VIGKAHVPVAAAAAPVLASRTLTPAPAPRPPGAVDGEGRADSQERDPVNDGTDGRSGEAHDGEHEGSGRKAAAHSEHETPEPDDGNDEAQHDEAQHSGDHAGVAPKATNPVVTVMVPVAAEARADDPPEPVATVDD
jgi:hypothetical protein